MDSGPTITRLVREVRRVDDASARENLPHARPVAQRVRHFHLILQMRIETLLIARPENFRGCVRRLRLAASCLMEFLVPSRGDVTKNESPIFICFAMAMNPLLLR